MAHYRLKHQRSKKVNKRLRLGYIPPHELRNSARARDAERELQESTFDRVSDLFLMIFDPRYDDHFENDDLHFAPPRTWNEIGGEDYFFEHHRAFNIGV